MVAEVPALDDRVKAVMEAEAAMEAQSAQGIVRFLVSLNTTPHAVKREHVNINRVNRRREVWWRTK